MITNYHTLRALAAEWNEQLAGSVIVECSTQVRGELAVLLDVYGQSNTLRFMTRPPVIGTFLGHGSKARHNAASVLQCARGRRIHSVRVAERDRILYVDLGGAWQLQAVLYGSRANVYLVGLDRLVEDAFRDAAAWRGLPAPEARAAPRVETPEDFIRRLSGVSAQAVARALPLFDRTLAAEVIHRAPHCRAEDLFAAAESVLNDIERPDPRVYWADGVFSLIPLGHLSPPASERFETVGRAVRVFAQHTLGQSRLRAERKPVEKALSRALADAKRKLGRMRAEYTAELPTDSYERFGHLLMAAQSTVPAGADSVTLPNIMSDGAPVEIPLAPSMTAVQNAERYYDKARRSREARRTLAARITASENRYRELAMVSKKLQNADTKTAFDAFRRAEKARLEALLPTYGNGGARPFRRFRLAGGYDVWVGRNARESDELTLHRARKYDLWMHARGVAGSHVVLRLPSRQCMPAKAVVEAAAAIAAHYSKARGSSLVPVIVTPRKYVRKPKGSSPGAVAVEREKVLLVRPALPTQCDVGKSGIK